MNYLISFLMLAIATIFISFNCIIVNAAISGLYVDNGLDQTVMYRPMTHEDQQEVEHEILQLLGLPDRPRKRHSHPSLRKSAPQFLLDVYKRLAEEENEGKSRGTRSVDDTDNLISDEDEKAIDESDMIMTFQNKNHHVAEVRHERGRRLWFDVSEVSHEQTLLMAELRLYQNPDLGKKKYSKTNFTISVYTIIKVDDGQKELELLSSKSVLADHHGWIELNVTEGLAKWISDPFQNKGLYISAHSIDKPDHEIKLEDIGLVNTKGDDQYQPFMIGFFNGQEIIHSKHSIAKRSAANAKQKRKKSEQRNPLMEPSRTSDSKSCQIQTLFVNFRDLKWNDWIIAPDGFGAYFCSGECNFPLNAHMNASNHAIVQTLVHLMYPSKVPKPCCAPTKLSPISVLYFLDESNVNLKKYKNMVVKSCGCH